MMKIERLAGPLFNARSGEEVEAKLRGTISADAVDLDEEASSRREKPEHEAASEEPAHEGTEREKTPQSSTLKSADPKRLHVVV